MVLAYDAQFLALIDKLRASQAGRPIKPAPWSRPTLDAADARFDAVARLLATREPYVPPRCIRCNGPETLAWASACREPACPCWLIGLGHDGGSSDDEAKDQAEDHGGIYR